MLADDVTRTTDGRTCPRRSVTRSARTCWRTATTRRSRARTQVGEPVIRQRVSRGARHAAGADRRPWMSRRSAAPGADRSAQATSSPSCDASWSTRPSASAAGARRGARWRAAVGRSRRGSPAPSRWRPRCSGSPCWGATEPAPPGGDDPRVVATIDVGGQPLDAALAAGSVWIADDTGRVLRLDPRSRALLAAIPAGERGPFGRRDRRRRMGGGARGRRPARPAHRSAHRSGDGDDPRADGLRRAPRRRPGGGLGRAGQSGARPGPADRRADQLPLDGLRLGGLYDLAVAGNVLWTLSDRGRRSNGATRAAGACSARPPGCALDSPAAGWRPPAGGVWVTTPGDGKVTYVGADMRVRVALELGAGGPLAAGEEAVWVAIQDVARRRFRGRAARPGRRRAWPGRARRAAAACAGVADGEARLGADRRRHPARDPLT